MPRPARIAPRRSSDTLADHIPTLGAAPLELVDGDGVGDNGDAFPLDATEQTDSDADGVGNHGDVFPQDATETLDFDNDGWLDIYFVQNGPTPGFVETEKLVDQYFRNRGDDNAALRMALSK